MDFLRTGLLILFLVGVPSSAAAQLGATSGWIIELIGIVQVEPGRNVITLGVRDEEIRFSAQDVLSSFRGFSAPQFLSEVRQRTPGINVRGPDHLLDLLLKEKPSKRILKLVGRYYPDPRRFVLTDIVTVQDRPKPQF